MTDEQNAPSVPEAEEDPRRQLWTRAAVAVGLIGLLLGGLIVFDEASRPPVVEEPKVPAKPIGPAPVAGRESEAPPEVLKAGAETADRTSEAPPLPTGATEGAQDKGESPRSARKADEAADETRPVVAGGSRAALSEAATAPVGKPVQGREDAPRTMSGTSPATGAAAPGGAASGTRRDVAVSGTAAPPGATAASVSPQDPRPVADVRAVPAGRAYVLQVGGFMDPAAAEALRGRLAQSGLPVQLESRVVVGPFADRREALATQSRLREQGYAPGAIQPGR